MDNHLVTEGMIQELEHAEAKIERAMKNAFYEVGAELRHINERRLYVLHHPTFEEYVFQRWEMSRDRAYQLMSASTIVDNLLTKVEFVNKLPSRESHVRPLLKLESSEHQAEVWQRIVSTTATITAKVVEAEVERKLSELAKAWYTLDEWEKLTETERERLLVAQANDKIMNRTNENIEWAAWSWNPVTGCRHGCEYCYADDIACRFYPQKFEPSFYPERLSMPNNTKIIPPRWEGDGGHNGVFVCSMADLFGDWVPQEWIDAVIEITRNSPQWTFIFLTKNPERLVNIDWPANAWVGMTVDIQARVNDAEYFFGQFEATQKFLSCEPMLEPLRFSDDYLYQFNWIIIGGRSKTSKLPEFQPDPRWVIDLSYKVMDSCRVYWKPNLTTRLREYP